jgi:hypothetical protein
MEVGSNRLAPQPEGLPRTEHVALRVPFRVAQRGHPARDRLSFDPTTSPPADKIGLNPMPSPLGRVPFRVEGQTDTPINRLHLGEVHSARDRFYLTQQPPRQRTRQDSTHALSFRTCAL